jgi:hypothetical protein
MKFYSQEVVKKAQILRKKGYTSKAIANIFHVADSTILRWCVDIPSKNGYHLFQLKKKIAAKERSEKVIQELNIDANKAKLYASLLYWCEGAKYPSTNFINFCNSDLNLIKTFIYFFRKGFKPKENKLKAQIQLHSTHDVKKILNFWSDNTQIPVYNFQKSTITKPTFKMKRINYMGTCSIRYYNVYLLIEIMGIAEAFFKKIIK